MALSAKETDDWRRKYLDSLRAMERDERLFRAQQQALYKLVGRLCLAAQGQAPQLDQELKRLKDAVRNECSPDTLESFGQSIADAVHTIDHGAATLGGTEHAAEDVLAVLTGSAAAQPAAVQVPQYSEALAGDVQIRAALSQLLSELRLDARLVMAVDAMEGTLSAPLSVAQLPQIVASVVEMVVQRIQGLERVRQEMEQLLSQLVSQLDSLTRYVEGNVQDESQRDTSNAELNLQITGEMRAMGESVATGTDVSTIRDALRLRMDSISHHLLDFRNREEQRATQARARTEQMRGRMDEMESEARKLQARLTKEKRLSLVDPLTQIANRLAYDQRIGEEMERWKRFAQPTCLAVWDIDKFKFINDNYGHRAGDKVLSVVAESLAKDIRSTDFVARYGGEEFVMLLPGTTLVDAMRLTNKIREAIATMGFHFRGAPVAITISCGVTALAVEDKAEDAFDRADGAMYRAKEAGRNRVLSA